MAANDEQQVFPTDTSSNVLQDIAKEVGQQVEMMILKAKVANEQKVSVEIQKIKQKMEMINEKVKRVNQRLATIDGQGEPILKDDLKRSIEKLEEVWEGEVSTLKHELWQTIQAHNHNADLMKHHKEAIDQVQAQIAESSTSGPEFSAIQEQLLQVDRVMQREQTKQQQIDNLMQRLANVQQQLTSGFGPWAVPPVPVVANMGMQMPVTQPANKKAAAKKAKSKASPAKAPAAVNAGGGSAAAAAACAAATQAANAQAKAGAAVAGGLPPGMRAEAPEFVPTGFDNNI